MSGIEIGQLSPAQLPGLLPALAEILAESVEAGGAIGFVGPLSQAECLAFWQGEIAPRLEAGERVMYVARLDGRLAGTAQLVLRLPPNQPHRCEIAKMMVRPRDRRRGVARLLLQALLDHASRLGRRLVTLDTRSDDVAVRLYAAAGFETAGIVPDYALDPDGRATHATTIMYRRLEPPRSQTSCG